MTDWYHSALLVTTTTTTTPSPSATSTIMSVSEKAVSPKVVSKMNLAEQLTADQQTSVRSGYAAATGVPMENVEMTEDARRTVSYTVTVFVKDSTADQPVITKLTDTETLKSALKDTVPWSSHLHHRLCHNCDSCPGHHNTSARRHHLRLTHQYIRINVTHTSPHVHTNYQPC